MLCLPRKAAFFNRGFSQVSSPSCLLCCLVLQSSDLAVDISPQHRRQRYASFKAQTKWGQLHAVNNSPLAGFGVLLASVCLCFSQWMCVRVGGDPTLPLTICCFNWEEKKIWDKGGVCARVCLRVSHSASCTSSWLCHGRLPFFLFQSIMVLRERACDSPFPSSSCSALPWVCKQISAHVTSRFASQLSSPSALPCYLCPPICRQKEGRMSQTLTNRAPASMLMCMCLYAHTPVPVYVRGREKRHLQQSQGRPRSVICAWLMSWQPKQSHLCEMEVRKRINDSSSFLTSHITKRYFCNSVILAFVLNICFVWSNIIYIYICKWWCHCFVTREPIERTWIRKYVCIWDCIDKIKSGKRKMTAKDVVFMPPPHQEPWLPIRWGREQLLGYWASCEAVKGSAAPLIPKGRERGRERVQ